MLPSKIEIFQQILHPHCLQNVGRKTESTLMMRLAPLVGAVISLVLLVSCITYSRLWTVSYRSSPYYRPTLDSCLFYPQLPAIILRVFHCRKVLSRHPVSGTHQLCEERNPHYSYRLIESAVTAGHPPSRIPTKLCLRASFMVDAPPVYCHKLQFHHSSWCYVPRVHPSTGALGTAPLFAACLPYLTR